MDNPEKLVHKTKENKRTTQHNMCWAQLLYIHVRKQN